MENSKISIITVCLNCSAAVEATYRSIVSQDYINYEWVVIDGNSTDGTFEILEKYKEDIAYLCSEPDSGIYEAMNKGITQSKGEYIVFMNAGDTFHNTNTLSTVSRNFGPDLLYGNTLKINNKGHEVSTYPNTLTKEYILNYTLSHQSSYFKKDIFFKYGMYDTFYRIAGDYDLYAQMIHNEEISFKYINETLSVFKQDGISNQKKHRDRLKFEQHHLRKKYFNNYKYTQKYWKYIIKKIFQTGFGLFSKR
jgi:glycosyltransferase involved in cell wall biosynthesis